MKLFKTEVREMELIKEYLKSKGVAEDSPLYRYYLENYRNFSKRAKEEVSFIKRYVKDFRSLKILDVGCGIGCLSIELAKEGVEVTGIDIDGELIKICNKNLNNLNLPISFHVMDAHNLSFPDNYFDVVIGTDFIEHVKNQVICAKELVRVLKPKGLLYLVTPNKAFPFEPEYNLLFLSYLPKRLADWYVRIMGRENIAGGKWDGYAVNLLTPRQLKKLFMSLSDLRVEVRPIFSDHRNSFLRNTLGLIEKLSKNINPLIWLTTHQILVGRKSQPRNLQLK